ncbi:MAG: aromatic ring-hydroxylating dioxygenase subunit alpha [Kamptonema sp. SIO4C4]|nr:aromatic ring-hydroxylating dioxygenase subunit alpha [Kamptonema sp. SIO4C4]
MLSSEPIQSSPKASIRTCGINPNHWYVVAKSVEVENQPVAVTLWKEQIVLYRDNANKIHALEDSCPHRRVKLSEGKVIHTVLECAYHGWQFDEQGNCVEIPYLQDKQRIPNCQVKSYPVQEKDGFIWLFLGNENPDTVPLLGVPEWEHLNYIASVATIDCRGHFSFLIENIMDMHHGHLHDDYQAWASAKLMNLEETEQRVDAYYEAQSYYKIDKIWSISQLFFSSLRQLHPDPLTVRYIYPHWTSTLGDDFKLYCLFCPIDETHTRAYLIHFTSLNAFWRLHKLPIPFRRFIKNRLFGAANGFLEGLVRQDVKMIEQEQQAYLTHPERKCYEINRAIASVQRLIQTQAANAHQP